MYAKLKDNTLEIAPRQVPLDGNMVIVSGKYYVQDGVKYICTRDTGNPVYHALKDLVGLYVDIVTE